MVEDFIVSVRTEVWNGARLRRNPGSCGISPGLRSLMVVARWRSESNNLETAWPKCRPSCINVPAIFVSSFISVFYRQRDR